MVELEHERIIKQQSTLRNILIDNNLIKDDGKPFPVSLSPYILTKEKHDKICKNSEKILSAIEKIIKAYENDKFIEDYFKEFSSIKDLITIKPNYSPWVKLARFDLAEDYSGNFHLMETNCAQPGGVTIVPKIKNYYEKLDLFKEFEREHTIVPQLIDNEFYFINSLIDTYQNIHQTPLNHIGFAYSKFQPLTTDMNQLSDQATSLGIKSSIFNILDLEVKKNKAWVNNCPLDLIHHKFNYISNAEGQSYLAMFEKDRREIPHYLEALTKQLCTFLNPIPAMTLAESKKIISLLQNKSVEYLFEEDELQAIEEFCPKTFLLKSYEKDCPDINHFANNKDSYVLKVAFSTRSSGVYVGKELSQNQWENALKKSQNIPSVLQEYIEHKSEMIYKDNEPTKELYRSNLSIYLIDGKASGLLCRATQDFKSNFYSGGICRPAYIIG